MCACRQPRNPYPEGMAGQSRRENAFRSLTCGIRPLSCSWYLTTPLECSLFRRHAIDRNGFVVTNDRFRDHAANDETLGKWARP